MQILKGKKIAPLAVVLVMGLLVGLGSAVVYSLWFGSVSSSYTVEGVSALNIKAGTVADFRDKVEGTTLGELLNGAQTATLKSNAAIISIDSTNLDAGKDLRLTIEVVDDATSAPITSSWTAAPEYFLWSTTGSNTDIVSVGTPTAGAGKTWVIASADFAKMTWGSPMTETGGHGLVIPISFGEAYALNGESFGTYNVHVNFTLDYVEP